MVISSTTKSMKNMWMVTAHMHMIQNNMSRGYRSGDCNGTYKSVKYHDDLLHISRNTKLRNRKHTNTIYNLQSENLKTTKKNKRTQNKAIQTNKNTRSALRQRKQKLRNDL